MNMSQSQAITQLSIQPRQPRPAHPQRLLGLACAALGFVMLFGQLQIHAAEPPSPTASPNGSVPSGPAQPAPPEIVAILRDLDAASSRQNLKAVLKFYSPNFTHGDGLTYSTLQQAVTTFWKDTKNLQYSTKINNWQAQGNGYILETTTTIQGIQTAAERDMKLSATVKAKTKIVNKQLVSQEILREQTRLSFGEKSPDVDVNLPDQVNVGQSFNFDVIVKNPIGEDLLLGAAVKEPITPEQYLKRTPIALEPLAAGGLFKIGQAPQQPSREWVSAVLIQQGGITIVSQRLNVVRPIASTASPR